MFRVSDRAAFDLLLRRSLTLLENGALVSEPQPYWKEPELWECRIETLCDEGSSIAENVWDCLRKAQSLAVDWRVAGSVLADDDGFSGTFAISQGGSTHIAGLEWAAFELRFV